MKLSETESRPLEDWLIGLAVLVGVSVFTYGGFILYKNFERFKGYLIQSLEVTLLVIAVTVMGLISIIDPVKKMDV